MRYVTCVSATRLLVLLVAFVLVTALAPYQRFAAASGNADCRVVRQRTIYPRAAHRRAILVGLALISVCDAVQRPHVSLLTWYRCGASRNRRMRGSAAARGKFGYLGMAVGRVAGVLLLATTASSYGAGLQTFVWRLKRQPFQQLQVLSRQSV